MKHSARSLRDLPLSLTAALLCVGLSAPAVAQQNEEEVRKDIEFARGLAAEWGFVDLAEQVIRNVEKAGVGSRMSENLGLVKCDIFAIGARNEADTKRRNELFESALAAYTQFIEEHPQSAARPEAEAALVDTSAMYARALTLAQEEAVGEEAEAMRERKVEVLTNAVARTGELVAALKAIPPQDMTEAQKKQLYNLLLNRGSMLLEIGKSQEDGSYSFERALSTLEDLVFTAGEATPFALRAYVVMGDTFAAQQMWEDASNFYMAVVAEAIPRDPEAWKAIVKDFELDQGAKEIRWLFVQLGTRGLVESLASAGDMNEALAWGLHLYNTQKREGFNFEAIGYLSLLEVARTLADAGGYVGGSLASGEAAWYETEEAMQEDRHSRRNQRTALELALSIAKDVNESNRGTTLQLRAQKLIADLINRPGVTVPPAQLFEAAQGEFFGGEYHKAIASFKRVLRTVQNEDKATRLEFGPKTLFYLGDSYRRLGRPMEAAMAFKEGATTWQGDPEFDVRNAQGLYQSAVEVQRRKGEDWKPFVADAEKIAMEIGTDDDNEIRFRNAEKARRNKEYAEARKLYEDIEPSANSYEKSRVWISFCKLREGQADTALREFTEYIEEYVEDPKNALESERAKGNRQEALATAEFYRSFILHAKAKQSGEKAAWQELVDKAKDYYEKYPLQDSYSPFVLQYVMEAYLALDQRQDARGVLDTLREDFKTAAKTKQAAVQFYKELETQLDSETDKERARQLEFEMADLLRVGNATPGAAFGNLRQEAKHWVNLREFTEAERATRKLLDRYDTDEEYAEQIRVHVMPDLAYILLEQQKTTEAKSILEAAVNSTDPKPSKGTLLDYCRAVTGWVTEDDRGQPTVVPGAGESDEEFETAISSLDAISRSSSIEKWECEWYALKFQIAFAYYAWGQKDSRKLDSARRQLDTFDADLSPNYPEIGQSCDEAEDRDVRLRYGDGVLRNRFLWLKNRLN